MNKEQYVNAIEKALVGHVSPQELQDTVAYYRDYIDMEIRKGKTEQEVLETLGNPRLLAKTIIMAKEHKVEHHQESIGQEERAHSSHSSGVNIPLPILILIIVLILMMVFSAVVSVLRFLMPIVVPIAAILIIISFIKKWKR